MVTRRKYKSRVAPAVADEPVTAAPASPDAPGAMNGADDANPFLRAHEALQHAESLQRQHQHRQSIGLAEPARSEAELRAIDQFVESIPNLSAHQRRFLRSHPTLMTSPYDDLMRHAILVARHAGIADDTPQMDHAILAGVARDIEHHRHLQALTSADARPTPQNAAMHADIDQHVADLESEAEQHMAAHRPAPVAPPPPPKRRTMPMSAPVSRDFVSVTGRPRQDNTLTADERQIAHNSFSDPHMSNEQKEYLYLKNRQKLHRMRESGEYSEQGRG
jgi:hypothetical protein